MKKLYTSPTVEKNEYEISDDIAVTSVSGANNDLTVEDNKDTGWGDIIH